MISKGYELETGILLRALDEKEFPESEVLLELSTGEIF